MDIELQSINNDKSTDDNHSKSTNVNLTWRERIQSSFKITSISMTVLLVWLLCETLLCVIVLNYMEHNYIENFINDICEKDKCPTMLAELLFWRIVVSSVAITGILTGLSSLASLWMLMNALGLSPLFPVIYSCFYEYSKLDDVLNKSSVIWMVVKFFLKCIMSENNES